tara:strand:+ start:76 stop:288 length:213 start_codon:yes stop_codon:yes gene_type:complete
MSKVSMEYIIEQINLIKKDLGSLISKISDIEQNFINVKYKMKELEKTKEHIYIVDKFVNDFQSERKRDND